MQAPQFFERLPISAYGDGTFRFDSFVHEGSVMCLPSGIYAWGVAKPSDLDEAAFERIWDEAESIEVTLIGTGEVFHPLSASLLARFRESGIGVEAMATGTALGAYNILLAEGREVAAALLAAP